jgi:hypothetical protein
MRSATVRTLHHRMRQERHVVHWVRWAMCAKCWLESLEEREHSEDPGKDRLIVLK